MSAARRGWMLSAATLAAALTFCIGQSHAQLRPLVQADGFTRSSGAGHHTLWNQSLRAEDVRGALERFAKGEAGENDPFIEMLKKTARQKNPNLPPEKVDEAVKKLMANKQFRDTFIDAIQKHQNQKTNGKRQDKGPRFTREELERLLKANPDARKGGDPFKIPDNIKIGPDQLPPFNPKSRNFDPERFKGIDPKNPPQFDPKTGFPLDENGRLFDPRNGRPVDPDNLPKIAPPPPVPPEIEMPQPEPLDGRHRLDPQNPLGTPPKTPEEMAKSKAVETATAIWEKNVGPIEDSPGVRKALIDLISDPDAMDFLSDGKGNTIFDALDKDNPDSEKFRDFFGNSKWEWPKFDLGWGRGNSDLDFDFGNRRPRDRGGWDMSWSRSRGSTSFDGMGSFNLGGMQVPWLLMILVVVAVIAGVLWWQWGAIFKRREAGAVLTESGGGWPIDPRQINSREDVVKAFEYLSVLLCGAGAKTWTHSTIADELSRLAQSEPDTALKLARLYELARYAPLDEPLTRAELLEARRLACELAGLDEA